MAETLNMLGLGYALELMTEFGRGSAPGQERLRAALASEGMSGLAKAFAQHSYDAGMKCAGITLQWSDFDAKDDFEIIDHEDRSDRLKALIDGLNPCIVFFLQRRDVLSQAVSHFLANESQYYHSTCPEELRPQRARVSYNRAEIEKFLSYTQRCYAEWSNLFARAGVVPQTLYYEDFVDNPLQSYADLAERIAGTSFKPEVIAAAAAFHSKISDEKDKAFRARYLEGA